MSDNSFVSSVVNAYEPYNSEATSKKGEAGKSSALGSEEFLTLLVAQLENQNPLDPADTEQFTDQLAQFSQVEQLINANDKLDKMLPGINGAGKDIDANKFVGLAVTAKVPAMTVEDGAATSGFYEVDQPAEVTVYVYDAAGTKVATLPQGQVDAGSYLISWDGKNDAGNSLKDGEYTYVVMANSGKGYEEVESYLSGKVDAVSYRNGKGYLVVSGVLVDPENVSTVTSPSSSSSGDSASVIEYLGTTVSSNYPIVQIKEGEVQGEALQFNLTDASDVTVTIYNADDEKVNEIQLPAEETDAGANSLAWNGLSNSGHVSADGLYYYTVAANKGTASTAVSGEVSAITAVDGTQYLEIGNTGRLVSISSITSVK